MMGGMAPRDESVMRGRGRRVEIIAHRGSSHLAPENTLASFQLGWRETTTCELDIHPALDGKLAVIHDDSAKRTTGVDFKVAEHPLSELRQLDAGAWKGIAWKGEKLPSLEEVIAAMPPGKRLLIEIKAGAEVIPELARVVRASDKEKGLLIHSFSHPACVEARKALPRMPIYLLFAARQNPVTGEWSFSIDEAIWKIKEAGLDGIGVNDTALVDASAVQKIHSNGLKLNIWTVDRVSQARRLVDLGVDGLITNRPGWLKARLGEAM